MFLGPKMTRNVCWLSMVVSYTIEKLWKEDFRRSKFLPHPKISPATQTTEGKLRPMSMLQFLYYIQYLILVIYNSVYDSIYNWWVKCFDELSIIFDILMILYICERNVILQSRFLMESPFVKTLVRKQYIYFLKSYNSICTIKSSPGSHVSNNQMLNALATFL